MQQKIFKLIEERKDELFSLLSSLVKINSESFGSYGNEEEIARYIHSLCQELGLQSDLYSPLSLPGFENHPDYLPGRSLENRYNVVAKWEGAEDENELMLMAHTDTVMIGDPENWDDDPLSGKIEDGKIFGRGACDDKYAIATSLFIIKLLKEQGFTPKKNLLFAAYSDEEYGGSHGAMAAVMKYPCKRIVSLDGDNNEIWHCGSGGQEVKYRFHTAFPADCAKAATKALSVVIDCMESFAQNRKQELENNRFYKGTIIPDTSLRYMGCRAGDNGQDLGRGELVFLFYTDKTEEEIYKEFSELEKVIAEKLKPFDIIGDGFTPTTRFFHYVFCEPDSEDITLMLKAAKETTGEDLLVCGSCLSDLSVISKYGTSRAYGYGVGRDFSEIGGAHQPNEFVECDKLVDFTKTVANYILKILG